MHGHKAVIIWVCAEEMLWQLLRLLQAKLEMRSGHMAKLMAHTDGSPQHVVQRSGDDSTPKEEPMASASNPVGPELDVP